MIDEVVFIKGVQLLSNHFDRFLLPEVTALWKTYLDQRLTTAQFEAAVELILLESQFFPTAKKLVEAVKGDAETNALHEWDVCLKAAARSDKSVISHLSAQGQSALYLVGGLYKLGMLTEEELRWVRKEFVAMYKATPADAQALPAASVVRAERLEAGRSL